MQKQPINFKELAQGTILYNGKYVVERILGAGGFGITYYAKHTGLNQYYAIKEFFINGSCVRDTQPNTVALQGIEPEMFEKYRKHFVEEARTLAQLDHPNIVKVVDVFDENGTSYIVMPFIAGETLKTKIAKNGKLSYGESVNFIAQLTEAVAYIHKHNILHRDIKPDNVIITPDNKAILIDFGSAREFIHDQVQDQTSIFTRGYAPIEQYSATSRKGNYTDIYSLGAVFYYIITGVKPMDAISRQSETMKEPIELVPQIPYGINQVIMKAMALKQEDRYQSVTEFMEDLLGDRPEMQVVKSPIITNSTAKHTNLKKNKIILWIVGTVGIAAIVFLLLFFFVFNKKEPIYTDTPMECIHSSGKKYDYKGDLKNNKPEGRGKAIFQSEDKEYTGEFKEGKFNGEGTLWYKGGGMYYDDYYVGVFKDDYIIKGERHYINTLSWTGEFKIIDDTIRLWNGSEIDSNSLKEMKYEYYNGKIVDSSKISIFGK